jgi:hypothetical protein
MGDPYATFDDFWLHYVRQHRSPTNRALHLVGTVAALAIASVAVAKRKPLLLLAAPAVAYGFSFAGHLVFEKNLPVTLSYPLRAIKGDLVMVAKMLTGRMQGEIARATAADAAAEGAAHAAASAPN